MWFFTEPTAWRARALGLLFRRSARLAPSIAIG